MKLRLLITLLLALGMAGLRQAPALAATTIMVTDCTSETGSGGSTGIGDAVAQANTDNANDLIQFSCNGTIPITSTLTISGSMTIDGSGQSVTLDGGTNTQLFSVSSGVTFDLQGLTLADGNAFTGGAIQNSGGAVDITDSTLSGNGAKAGGAIDNSGTLTITSSTFSDNSAGPGSGGAIDNSGTATITTSTFASNGAEGGGAIYNDPGATLTISNSTFTDNQAAFGGAIFNDGTLTLTNSTFSGNTAGNSGGAIDSDGTLTISNSTLSDNSAPSGAAIFNSAGTVSIGGSIIADNLYGRNCFILGGTDAGYNLEDDTGASCGFSSTYHDLVGQDPKLGSLATNGGPTQTMALQSGSPAIDYIPTWSGLCTITDQRGATRPDAGETRCDIGAYEFQDPLATHLTITPNPVAPGQTVSIHAAVTNDAPVAEQVTLTISITLPNGTTYHSDPYTTSIGAEKTIAWTWSFRVPQQTPAGTYTVTLIANDPLGSSKSTVHETVS